MRKFWEEYQQKNNKRNCQIDWVDEASGRMNNDKRPMPTILLQTFSKPGINVDPKSLGGEKGMATYNAIGNEIKVLLPHCNIIS